MTSLFNRSFRSEKLHWFENFLRHFVLNNQQFNFIDLKLCFQGWKFSFLVSFSFWLDVKYFYCVKKYIYISLNIYKYGDNKKLDKLLFYLYWEKETSSNLGNTNKDSLEISLLLKKIIDHNMTSDKSTLKKKNFRLI